MTRIKTLREQHSTATSVRKEQMKSVTEAQREQADFLSKNNKLLNEVGQLLKNEAQERGKYLESLKKYKDEIEQEQKDLAEGMQVFMSRAKLYKTKLRLLSLVLGLSVGLVMGSIGMLHLAAPEKANMTLEELVKDFTR